MRTRQLLVATLKEFTVAVGAAASRWLIRLIAVGVVAAASNYLLYTGDSRANNYAVIYEFNQASYNGLKGDIWVGDPSPCCVNPGFSNATLWVVNGANCPQIYPFVSWIEHGWYEGWKAGVFGRYYKVIYKVPGQFNCTYQEEPISGTPQLNTTFNSRLERCLDCGGTEWRWYWNNVWMASVQSGWSLATRVNAGGEVRNDGEGMQGAIYNMKYRRSQTWFTLSSAVDDGDECSPGYTLQWIGTDDISFSNGAGGCPP